VIEVNVSLASEPVRLSSWKSFRLISQNCLSLSDDVTCIDYFETLSGEGASNGLIEVLAPF